MFSPTLGRFALAASLAFGALGCAAANANTTAWSPNAPGYEWQSPQGWRGGSFSVPPAFAPDLAFHGREVLRFSPGYYDASAPDFWTYAFVFLLPRDADTSAASVEPQLVSYFRGLGANLGSHAQRDLPASEIQVRRLAEHGTWHRAQVRAFDPWETGAAIELNIEWSARPCDGHHRQALLFKISPLPFEAEVWTQLDAEVSALRCR